MVVTLLGIIVYLHPAIKVFDDVLIIALQLLRESYFVFPLPTDMEVRLLQPQKARSPMDVTELGIVSEPVKPLQPEKAPFPIEFTELDIVNDPLNPLHSEKA